MKIIHELAIVCEYFHVYTSSFWPCLYLKKSYNPLLISSYVPAVVKSNAVASSKNYPIDSRASLPHSPGNNSIFDMSEIKGRSSIRVEEAGWKSLTITTTESSGPHPRDLGLTTPYDSETGIDGEKKDPYDRFPSYRKTLMLVVQSWCGFMSPISSTAILPALPNVATTFNTNGTVVSLSNALYIVFMAISPCLWGPVCQFYGRKRVESTRPPTPAHAFTHITY